MGAKQSYITVVNYTDRDITIKVTEISNQDWEGNNRPDINLNDVVIARGKEKRVEADVNGWMQNSWFRMTIYDANGNKGTFRTDQQQVLRETTVFDEPMDEIDGKKDYIVKHLCWQGNSNENIFLVAKRYKD